LSGAPTSASLTVNLPSGLSINGTIMSEGAFSSDVAILDDSTGTRYHAWCEVGSGPSVAVVIDTSAASAYGPVTQAVPVTFDTGDTLIGMVGPIPVDGWQG
jgi:hypothetical protein